MITLFLILYFFQIFIVVLIFLLSSPYKIFNNKKEFYVSLIPLGFFYPIIMNIKYKLWEYDNN